jgi:hypothetical protein
VRGAAVADTPLASLRALDRLKAGYGPGAAARKLALLRGLDRGRLGRAGDVLRLHEILCWLRAYPDDAPVLARVERMLRAFPRRGDLRRHAASLADSGIAGTEIRFRFFQPTASDLARRFPRLLRIDWKSFRNQDLLERLLPLLSLYAETPALDEYALTPREWVERMKDRRETDAHWLVRRFDALRVDPFVREKLYDELDAPLVLSPGPGTPARTNAKDGAAQGARRGAAAVFYQMEPLSRARPGLPEEIFRPPLAVRSVPPRRGRALIALAREAMVTRARDLDVFCWASPDDVRLVDCGRGLQFACIGVVPERRLMLEAVYGLLTLKNGVPIGYVLMSALFGSSEIAYNVFETYRGAEAGAVYGRVLATARALFGVDAFTIYPYQLGHGNPEAIRSGAWWFYRKLGFVPRDAQTVRLMRREAARMKTDPGHLSSPATLEKLAAQNLFYQTGRPRKDVIGVLSLADVGLRVTKRVAERFGSDREGAAKECSREAARALGVRTFGGFTRGERMAWERWAPLVTILPGLERWSKGARRALVDVIRAKGGRRESDFVLLFDRHRPLRRAVAALAREAD